LNFSRAFSISGEESICSQGLRASVAQIETTRTIFGNFRTEKFLVLLQPSQPLFVSLVQTLQRRAMTTPGNLRIGLFGAGIVGGGICELIQKHTANGRFGKLGVSMEIVKICVRSPESERDFKSSRSYVYVSDRNEILNDKSINCVVEVMGGTTDAKDIVLAAIRAGKHIVSANKALIANHLEEIQAALAANPSVL
jgi:hypothetical protein